MNAQSKDLRWLRMTVAITGLLQLGFCAGALVVQDVYLLETVVEERMGFLDRSIGYRTNSVRACLLLRNLQLNFISTPNQESVNKVLAVFEESRIALRSISTAMLQVHSLNYISPPSNTVS
jgi:hypothetical protein